MLSAIEFIIITILSLIVLIYFGYWFLVLIKKTGNNTAQIESSIIENFNNEQQYYREIIKNYSPAILDYLNNLEINEKSLYIILLSLVNKHKIELKEKIEIISNEISDLTSTEIYVYYLIQDGFVKYNKEILSKQIEEEAFQKKIIDKPKKTIFDLKYLYFFFGIIATVLYCMDSENFEKININYNSPVFMICIISLFAFVVIFVFCHGYEVRHNSLKAITKEGKTINAKLNGLKKYIKDYSNLEYSKQEELKIWDDYYIYSVIFNQNENIKSNIEKYILFPQ